MSEDVKLGGLALHLALLSLTAIGGGVVLVAPDVHHYVSVQNHWLTDQQFASAYALAQAAPGPNLLFVTLIGWMIKGWVGAVVVTLAAILPSTCLVLALGAFINRHGGGEGRWAGALRDALAPLAAGMLAGAAWTFLSVSGTGWRGIALALAAATAAYATKLNPVWLIVLGALAGAVGLV
ncbi:chromate transporter [Pseudoduganella sp. DS3]|uniref:Chromate transporter n=1 Tax=Pseudoduganella guangdongensis TaxID=2692179 RepID=A0A6N9HDT2_9BURK|nr:chromate transporter [Pseudoduganella guangdongensis]MYN01711.1 chromate transporter [Pseudoduganella guangdongensis]